jgi:hypothetical protein
MQGDVMSLGRLSGIAFLTCALAGCLNSATVITVKRDGSGTLEQTLLVNKQAFKGIMGGIGGGAGQVTQSAGVLNEAEFKRAAERMGVRPVSLTPVKDGSFEGARALYAFDDVSTIRVDQEPPMAASSSAEPAKPAATSSPIRFTFAKQDSTSVLTLIFDEKAASDAGAKVPPAAAEPIDPAMLQMIKSVFQGLKVAIDLELDGTIVKTNADYVTGSRVALVEIDMAAVLEDDDTLKVLQSRIRPGVTISELKPFLKNVKGVKINHPTVTIEYR